MKTNRQLLPAVLALAVAAPAFAAPKPANMCSTEDQTGYQASRDAAEDKLGEVNSSAESENAAITALQSELDSIDFSKQPSSRPILAKGIDALKTELRKIHDNADKYAGAYAVGLGDQALSTAQQGLASTANGLFSSAAKSRENIAAVADKVQKVRGPREAMRLKNELDNRLEKARLIANYEAKALRDAGSAHGRIGDCAGKFEAAQNAGKDQQEQAEKGGPAKKEAEQLAQAKPQPKNPSGAPDLSSAKQREYGPGIGEWSYDQTHGHFGALQPGDVALSPDLLKQYPYGSIINYQGVDYRVADVSYVSPGNPNRNVVEIWRPPK